MARMQLIIVRHASHEGGRLTPRGRHHVDRLARALENRGVRPTLILSSARPQAGETSDILARRLAGAAPLVHRAGPLYPIAGNPGDFEAVLLAARLAGIELGEHETVLLVGHEGRVSGLVVQVTGARSRPIPAAGAVAVCADSLEALLKGRGTIDFCYPVVDHQEAALRPKVQSKMTVATFLAGFVSAALVTSLFAEQFTGARQLAAVFLTLALALFVITVYIYNELGMPEGYWVRGARGRRLGRGRLVDAVSSGRIRTWLGERREREVERKWRRHTSGSEPQEERLLEARWIHDDHEWWQLSPTSTSPNCPKTGRSTRGWSRRGAWCLPPRLCWPWLVSAS
jgi:phosphohistidine phosphatase SixA